MKTLLTFALSSLFVSFAQADSRVLLDCRTPGFLSGYLATTDQGLVANLLDGYATTQSREGLLKCAEDAAGFECSGTWAMGKKVTARFTQDETGNFKLSFKRFFSNVPVTIDCQ